MRSDRDIELVAVWRDMRAAAPESEERSELLRLFIWLVRDADRRRPKPPPALQRDRTEHSKAPLRATLGDLIRWKARG